MWARALEWVGEENSSSVIPFSSLWWGILSLDRDSFIGDHRPRNGTERLIGKCQLRWVPRIQRHMLPSDCVIRINFRDVSDYHNACGVNKNDYSGKCWVRELRCPGLEIWTMRVSTCCLLMVFEPWISSDLVQNPIQKAVDPRRFCQIAVAAVIMGDLNAVYAVEAAHRRQLLSVGSLRT